MLDWRRVLNDVPGFQSALLSRGFKKADVDLISVNLEKASASRVSLQQNCDDLKSQKNKTSALVSDLMKSGKKSEAMPLIDEGKRIGEKIAEIEAKLEQAESQFRGILETVPNWPHESVPVGKDASENHEIRKVGNPKNFSFQPKSHDELAEGNGWIDFARAARTTAARFSYIRGPYARLERALTNFMIDLHRSKGYEEIEAPYIVNSKSLFGTGQLPKFGEDLFKIEGWDAYLIPTSEVSVTNLFADEILDSAILPKKFTSFSPCFRSEAGSYGRDTKGLIRQHQFHKVELIKFVPQENSLDELEGMVSDAEDVLRKLEIPFRTVLLCTGDMGFGSRKTYDIEVWLPGSTQEGQTGRGCYREISSCSDCGDFQARRAAIRYRPDGKKTAFVHTLNGSGLAVGRTLIAVLENYQNEDGSISIPTVLQPYMGGEKVIAAK
jgi:seryl-tRNA synthetase